MPVVQGTGTAEKVDEQLTLLTGQRRTLSGMERVGKVPAIRAYVGLFKLEYIQGLLQLRHCLRQ